MNYNNILKPNMLLVMESTNNPLASEADVVTLTRPIRRRPQVAPVEAVVSEAVPVKVASVEAVASEIAPIEAVPIEAIRVSTKEAIPKIIKGKPKVAVERTNEEIALAIAIKEAKLASSKDITPRQAGETEEGHILTKKSECIITKNRGYRADGSRNPHTWNLVEKKGLIKWL